MREALSGTLSKPELWVTEAPSLDASLCHFCQSEIMCTVPWQGLMDSQLRWPLF